MLVISQKKGDKLHIGRDITISIIDARSGKVRLGIDAPSDCPVLRKTLINSQSSNLTPAQAELALYKKNKEKAEKAHQNAKKAPESKAPASLEGEANTKAQVKPTSQKGDGDINSPVEPKNKKNFKNHPKKSDRLLKKKAKLQNNKRDDTSSANFASSANDASKVALANSTHYNSSDNAKGISNKIATLNTNADPNGGNTNDHVTDASSHANANASGKTPANEESKAALKSNASSNEASHEDAGSSLSKEESKKHQKGHNKQSNGLNKGAVKAKNNAAKPIAEGNLAQSKGSGEKTPSSLDAALSKIEESALIVKADEKAVFVDKSSAVDNKGVAKNTSELSHKESDVSDPFKKDHASVHSSSDESTTKFNKHDGLATNASLHDEAKANSVKDSEAAPSHGNAHVKSLAEVELPPLVPEDIIEDPLGLVRSLGDAYIDEPEQESIPSKRKASRKRLAEAEDDSKKAKSKNKAKKK